MRAKQVEAKCEQCEKDIVIDFETADFSVQLSNINGVKEEKRTYFLQCPNCKKITTIDSIDKSEWGNRKGPSLKKAFLGMGAGCVLSVAVGVAVIWFAIKGIITLFDWLM